MPAPYSIDFREKIISVLKLEEDSQKNIAERFNVSTPFISKLWKQHKETGTVAPKKVGGNVKPKVTPEGEDHLREWLLNEPDLTLGALCEKYKKHFHININVSSINRALKRMKITFKKKHHTHHKKTRLVLKN